MCSNIKHNLGIEIQNFSGAIDLDASNKSYADLLLERDYEKYIIIVNAYKKIGLLINFLSLNNPDLQETLFQNINFKGRGEDDIFDKDLLVDISDEERLELYKNFLEGNYEQVPYIELLAKEIRKISKILGKEQEIEEVLKKIVETVTFDFKRSIGEEKYLSKNELEENFYKLDIEGTIGGMAIILDFDYNDTIKKLEPLGIASRIAYNLQDLTDDIRKNLCTITKENITIFGITEDDIEYISGFDKIWDVDNIPKSIQNYINDQINNIQLQLNNHNKEFSISSIIKGGGLISNDKYKGKKNVSWNDLNELNSRKEKLFVKGLFTLRALGMQSNVVDNLGMKKAFDDAYKDEIFKTVNKFSGKLNNII
ncbi:hypothetical protein LR004_00575 [Candidatus Gracilibacteria bacterium]|nr:hypothetical protein [Candidatus Gracilibacteria bacterium]